MSRGYNMGCLAAALVQRGYLEQGPDMAKGLSAALNQFMANANGNDFTWIARVAVEFLPEIGIPSLLSEPLSNEEESDFWLGYYHQRPHVRAGGTPHTRRPSARARVEDGIKITILLPEPLWEWIKGRGGVGLIRAIMEEEYSQKGGA